MERAQKISISAITLILLITATLIAAGNTDYLGPGNNQSSPNLDTDLDNLSQVQIRTDDTDFTNISVEVADNKSERREGLMNRESLCQSCGMLFVYPDADERAFWMKNTLIPLDIIFISADKKVLNVETAYPEPNTSDSDLTRYWSDGQAKYVLEVNAGYAEEKGIEKGIGVRLES